MLGIIFGLTAALLQSISYVCCAFFLKKKGDSVQLLFHSCLWMGVFGLVSLLLILPWSMYPISWKGGMVVIPWLGMFFMGQWSFMLAQKEIESSRLSSLQGLKIIVLATLVCLVERTNLHLIQWLGVILCAVAAVGMNLTGGKISLKGLLGLGGIMFFYAVADYLATMMVLLPGSGNMLFDSLASTGMGYGLLGLVSALVFLLAGKRIKFNWNLFMASLPYATSWFCAMIFLFGSFGISGPIFGNILQAFRGIISVLLGVVLLTTPLAFLENRAPHRIWIRRGVMALLMMVALALYAYGRTLAS